MEGSTRDVSRLYLTLSESVLQVAQAYAIDRDGVFLDMLVAIEHGHVLSQTVNAELREEIKEKKQLGIYIAQEVSYD